MMKMMTKTAAILMVLVMALLIFTACSDKTEDNTNSASSQGAASSQGEAVIDYSKPAVTVEFGDGVATKNVRDDIVFHDTAENTVVKVEGTCTIDSDGQAWVGNPDADNDLLNIVIRFTIDDSSDYPADGDHITVCGRVVYENETSGGYLAAPKDQVTVQ